MKYQRGEGELLAILFVAFLIWLTTGVVGTIADDDFAKDCKTKGGIPAVKDRLCLKPNQVVK